MISELISVGLFSLGVLCSSFSIDSNSSDISIRANDPNARPIYLDVDSSRGVVKNGSNYSLSVKAYNNEVDFTFTSVELYMSINYNPYYQLISSYSFTKEFKHGTYYLAEFNFDGVSWAIGAQSPDLFIRFKTSSNNYDSHTERFSVVGVAPDLINDIQRYYFTYDDFVNYSYSYTGSSDLSYYETTNKSNPFYKLQINNKSLYIYVPDWVQFAFGVPVSLRFNFNFSGSINHSFYFDNEQNNLEFNDEVIKVNSFRYDIEINRFELELASRPTGLNNASFTSTIGSGTYLYSYYGTLPDTGEPPSISPPIITNKVVFNFTIPDNIKSKFYELYFETDLFTITDEKFDYNDYNLIDSPFIEIPKSYIDTVYEHQPTTFEFTGSLKEPASGFDKFTNSLSLKVSFESDVYSFDGNSRNDIDWLFSSSVVVDNVAGVIDSNYSSSGVTNIGIDILSFSKVGFSNDVEVVDVAGLLFTIISLPFTFFSQAFDLTLFSGTAYAINIGDVFLLIVAILIIIAVIKLIMSIKG